MGHSLCEMTSGNNYINVFHCFYLINIKTHEHFFLFDEVQI